MSLEITECITPVISEPVVITQEPKTIGNSNLKPGDYFSIYYYGNMHEIYKFLGESSEKYYLGTLTHVRRVGRYSYNEFDKKASPVNLDTAYQTSVLGATKLTNTHLDLKDMVTSYDTNISITNPELIKNHYLCIDDIYYTVIQKFKDQLDYGVNGKTFTSIKSTIRKILKARVHQYIACDVTINGNKFAITLIDKTPPPAPEKPPEEPKINRLNLIKFQ